MLFRGRRVTEVVAISLAMLLGVFALAGVVAYAEPGVTQVRYDAGAYGWFDGDGMDASQVKVVEEDEGATHSVIGAPNAAPDSTAVLTASLDLGGGTLGDGTQSGTWTQLVSTRSTFREWNTALDGRGMAYHPGDLIDMASVGGQLSLYAQYDTEGLVTSEDLPNAALDGHVFDGWFTQAEGGDLVGRAGDKPSVAVGAPSGSYAVLYAHWTPVGQASGQIPDTASGEFKGDLPQAGTMGADATPLVVLFVMAGIGSAVFLYFARKS